MLEQPNQGTPETPRELGRRHPIAEQRERNARLQEQAARIAESSSLLKANPTVPLVMVPANTREIAELPAEMRAAFLDRLEATVHRVFVASTSTPVAETSDTAFAPALQAGDPTDSPAMTAIMGRSCATCRGKCCTAGGDHAFLREDTIERLHRERPSLDESQMLALFAKYLPAHHYDGSCVYHDLHGCALPRALRSDLCNRYVCGGLTQLRRALSDYQRPQAFVAAASSHDLRRMALVSDIEMLPVEIE